MKEREKAVLWEREREREGEKAVLWVREGESCFMREGEKTTLWERERERAVLFRDLRDGDRVWVFCLWRASSYPCVWVFCLWRASSYPCVWVFCLWRASSYPCVWVFCLWRESSYPCVWVFCLWRASSYPCVWVFCLWRASSYPCVWVFCLWRASSYPYVWIWFDQYFNWQTRSAMSSSSQQLTSLFLFLFCLFVWLHHLFQLFYTLFFWTLSNISNDTTIPHISSFHHQVNTKQSTVIHFIIGKTFIRCDHGGNAKPSTTPTYPVYKQMLKPVKFSCSLFNNNKINRIWVTTEWNHERTQSRWCSLSLNKQKL